MLGARGEFTAAYADIDNTDAVKKLRGNKYLTKSFLSFSLLKGFNHSGLVLINFYSGTLIFSWGYLAYRKPSF